MGLKAHLATFRPLGILPDIKVKNIITVSCLGITPLPALEIADLFLCLWHQVGKKKVEVPWEEPKNIHSCYTSVLPWQELHS